MDASQKIYPRVLIGQGTSTMITIPTPILQKMGLERGQHVLVCISGGTIIIKPAELKMSKKDLKVNESIGEQAEKETKKKHGNPTNGPKPNPLHRLKLK